MKIDFEKGEKVQFTKDFLSLLFLDFWIINTY